MTISSWNSPNPTRAADAVPDVLLREVGMADGTRTDSFEGFVLATGHRMHRAALLLCGGDHHLAEDLTQATYTKIFLAWKRVSRTEDPVAYSRKVLTRTYLSHRRLRRSSERPTDELPDPPDPQSGDRVTRLDLMNALGLLSAQDRAVLVLRYWLDLDVAATADILGVGQDAVRQRARRALTRLRAQIPDLDVHQEQE